MTSDVAARRVFPKRELDARTSTSNCNDNAKRSDVSNSIGFARSMSGGAAQDIRDRPNSNEWNKFFGGNNRDENWASFDKIAGDLPSSGNRQ